MSPLLHLIEIRLRSGRTELAAEDIRQFVDAKPDSVLAAQVEIMFSCVRDGPRRTGWDDNAASRPLPTLTAALSLQRARGTPCDSRRTGSLR